MNILYEDKEIIVCVKEPGVLTQSGKTRDKDMVNMLRNYVLESEHGYTKQDGIPFIGLVHRLDRPVGGVMVFAKTPRSLKQLNISMSSNSFNKRYLAISIGESKDIGKWVHLEDYLLKDGKDNVSRVVKDGTVGAKLAKLDYKALDVKDGMTLYEIKLHTGRHHQIRAQMSNHGMPLLGDTKYNPSCGKGQVALYSYKLEFEHPINNKEMRFIYIPTHNEFGKFKINLK